jgi:hypothetical protein
VLEYNATADCVHSPGHAVWCGVVFLTCRGIASEGGGLKVVCVTQ